MGEERDSNFEGLWLKVFKHLIIRVGYNVGAIFTRIIGFEG